jgi:type III secretion system FlhB-like substrate exporter
MMDAYKNNKLKIVFNCEYQDVAIIDHHFKLLSKDHIVVDTLKMYTICNSIPESIYPAIVYVNNNIIKKVEYYNSKNIHAYEKVKSYLY